MSMKKCIIFFTLVSAISNADTALTSGALRSFGGPFEVGIGYNPEINEFTVTRCVNGKVTEKVLSVQTAPFEAQVIAVDGDVKIVFEALSTYRKVYSVESDGKMINFVNPNKLAVCGSEYTNEIHIGGLIRIERTFSVYPESKDKLIEILKERVKDLRSLSLLDLSKDGIKGNGGGFGYSGNGITKELSDAITKCMWSGEQCDLFVEKAYETAMKLDQVFPEGRVANLVNSAPVGQTADFGSTVLVKTKSYSK